ncbi:MAG: DUF4149 domain-containing protein [Candidatus Eremiobacteraeota bacterium]|nr:DUF4149 domain-containing protein [Candidatus Eremiobacteraeota bacterium]
MERAFAVIEALALALWIGALAGFAFVFAPLAFRTLGDVTLFGALAASVLHVLNETGYACGAIALISIFVRNREDASLATGSARRAVLVFIMLVLLVLQDRVVMPAVHVAGDATFGRLHLFSTVLYALVLALGLVTLAMSVLARPESIRRRFGR